MMKASTCCCITLFLLHSIADVHCLSGAGNLSDLSAMQAVKALCDRSITAVQYAQALLDRAEEIDCLNTYASIRPQQVLEEAAQIDAKAEAGEDIRPLCGLSFAVKDNIDIAGFPTVAGTPALEGFIVDESAPLINKLRQAHGVVLGKTRMHELAEGYTTINSHFGATLNPYSVDSHVGGSSGGTGALVAARGVSAGFCTDTGGSCRVPAALTGTVGYRPTTKGPEQQQCYHVGSGLIPMTTTRDTVGLMARNMEDILFLDAIFNDCPRSDKVAQLQGLRVGLPREWWEDLGDETTDAYSAALEALRGAGVELVDFDVGLMLAEQRLKAPDNFTYAYEMPREISRYLYNHRSKISLVEVIEQISSPLVKESLANWAYKPIDSWPTPNDYLHMLTNVTPKITQLWNDYFDNLGFEVVIVPTTPITARPIHAAEPVSEINGRIEDSLLVYARTAELDCPSEVPGLSLPIGLASDNLPLGIQLHSRPGDDGTLLAVGLAMEAVFASTPPPPRMPACHGCKARVSPKTPSDNVPEPNDRKSAHLAAEMLSVYNLDFEGSCEVQHQQMERWEL